MIVVLHIDMSIDISPSDHVNTRSGAGGAGAGFESANAIELQATSITTIEERRMPHCNAVTRGAVASSAHSWRAQHEAERQPVLRMELRDSQSQQCSASAWSGVPASQRRARPAMHEPTPT